MIKKIRFFLAQLKTIRRINRSGLLIDSSGSVENDLNLKLSNGKYFFSYGSPIYLNRLHPLLRKDLRKKVSPNYMNVLFYIDFRYIGHRKNKQNLKEGKYLDLDKGNVVFEIGAYIGFHAMKMSELVDDKDMIYAIEAIPSNFELLKKNIEYNKIKNIVPINLAVWKNKGEISFNVDENQKNSAIENVVNSQKKIDIPCDTLDNIISYYKIKRPDFNRVQTNGVELQALEGMKKTL